jgi:hypothetical protein
LSSLAEITNKKGREGIINSTMCVGNDVHAPEKKGNEKERPTTRNML